MHCDACEEKTELFRCDLCRKGLCRQCGGYNASEIKVLELKKRVLKFFCPQCLQADANVALGGVIEAKSETIASKDKIIYWKVSYCI